MAEPLDLIILPASGSPEDAELLAELAERLARLVEDRTLRVLMAPADSPPQTGPARGFQLVLFPASPDCAARRDLWEAPLARALGEQLQGRAVVFALHLRRHDWSGTPVADLMRLPADDRAITEWSDRAQAWDEVLRSIRAVALRDLVVRPLSTGVASPRGSADAERAQRVLSTGIASPRGSTDAERAQRARLRGRPQVIFPQAGPAPFSAPSPSNPWFVGRDESIAEIRRRLCEPSPSSWSKAVVQLVGPAGAGKTEVAIAYAHRHRADYRGGVFWVDAAAGGDVLGALTEQLRDPSRRVGDDRGSRHELRHGLSGRRQWLLVIDAIGRRGGSRELDSFLFSMDVPPDCAVLITTRSSFHQHGSQEIPIGPLRRADAATLLCAAAHRPAPSDGGEAAAAGLIADALDGLPIALCVAGAWLARHRDASFSEYLHQLDSLAAEYEGALEPYREPDPATTAQRAAFALSWTALPPSAQDVFRLLVASAGKPLSSPRLITLAGMPAAAFATALTQLDEAAFLEGGASRDPPRASGGVARLAGNTLGDLDSFTRTVALRALSGLVDLARLEQEVKDRGAGALLTELEALAQIWKKRVPSWLDALLVVLRPQSHHLASWDPKTDPDGLLVQVRDAAFEAGLDDLQQRAEAALRARERPWLRRSSRTSSGTERMIGMHDSAVTAVVLSADGKLALSGSEDGVVMCWNVEDGTLVAELRGHGGAVRDIAITPDCQLAVSASEDGTLKVWELPAGTERVTLEWHVAGVHSVMLSHDGRSATSHAHDGCSCEWDLATGQPTRMSEAPALPVRTTSVSAGNIGVAASPKNDLLIRDLESGQVQRALVGHTGRILCAALHADGRRLVSGSADWTARVWDTTRGASLVPTSDIVRVAMTRDGALAISASRDGTLAVWDASTRLLRKTFRTAQSGNFSILAAAAHHVVIASDVAVELWDLDTAERIRELPQTGRLGSVAIAPSGLRAAAVAPLQGRATPTMALVAWDLETGALLRSVECELQGGDIAMVDEDRALVREPQGLREVSLETGETTRLLSGLGQLTGPLHAAPAARGVFCVVDGQMAIIDIDRGRPAWPAPLGVSGREALTAGRCLALTPDGRWMATIMSASASLQRAEDPTLVVYDVLGQRVVGRLGLQFRPIACAISPGGDAVFLGSNIDARRRVIKTYRDGGGGDGWFKEDMERQARVHFVDRVT